MKTNDTSQSGIPITFSFCKIKIWQRKWFCDDDDDDDDDDDGGGGGDDSDNCFY